MLNWLAAHITLPYILIFSAGLLAGYAINWYMCYRKHKKIGEPMATKRDGFTTIVGIIIISAMVWIMVSTQQARQCAINLNVSVSNEQAIAKIERDALTMVFFKALNPPPDVAATPPNSPERQAWGKQLGAEYFAKVNEAAKKREENQEIQRAAERACGQK